MGGNRGGLTGQRGGRGGGVFMNSGGGRGGGVNQQNALRGHGSRGSFGKEFHGRRGGSFNPGHQHHQNNAAFRGRGQGHTSARAGRQDGSTSFGNRDASQFASSGKKDENRRTLTDFKIVGLEMPELGWSWGALPSPVKAEEKEVVASLLDSPQVKDQEIGTTKLTGAPKSENVPATDTTEVKADASYQEQSSSTTTPPPSRIRIYFHTPVSPDDSHPIPHNSSYTAPPDTRKGKRKKLEDDDGDAEEGRERPPPPRSSQMDDNVSVDMDGVGRGSTAPSVAETASEGDWLMAAIAEDEGDVGADADTVAATVDGTDEEERHAASDPHFIPATNTFLNGDGDGNGELNPPFFALGGCFRAWGERPFVAQGYNRLTHILKASIILTWTELPLQEVFLSLMFMSLITHILRTTLSWMLPSHQCHQILLQLTLVHPMLVLSLHSRTWIVWFLCLTVVIMQLVPLLRWLSALSAMKMLIGSLIHRLL